MPKGRARPFVKLYDDLLGNPKLNRAAELVQEQRPTWSLMMARAMVLHAWAEMATAAIRNLTDGRVQAYVINGLEEGALIVPVLVRVGLCNSRAGEIWLHNWLNYYPSAAVIKDRLKANAARQKRFRNRHSADDVSLTQKPN